MNRPKFLISIPSETSDIDYNRIIGEIDTWFNNPNSQEFLVIRAGEVTLEVLPDMKRGKKK